LRLPKLFKNNRTGTSPVPAKISPEKEFGNGLEDWQPKKGKGLRNAERKVFSYKI
jgi:hypothetical protein